MQNSSKEWLVRTRAGEILGPFSQHELIEEIHKRTFTSQDEIAPSQGYWISAQTLDHHEAGEFTHTSTRSQTYPKSNPQIATAVPAVGQPIESSDHGQEDLTPTPDFSSQRRNQSKFQSSGTAQLAPPSAPDVKSVINPKAPKAKAITPVIIGVIIVAIFIAIAFRVRRSDEAANPAVVDKNPVASTAIREGDSPFVRQIYGLIRSGETQLALKQLTQYHERGPAKGDVEYLIPYAALLILEKESPGRAKKLLEQVLSTDTSPQLKSRAHHWLGYLLLNTGEGDTGESHFLEALQLNPKDPSARFNLGRSYQEQEKYTQALDYLQLAELEVPDLWLVHLYKGSARVQLKNPEEARHSFATALTAAPDRWIIYVYYALFLKGNREEESAQSIMKKMLLRDPSFELQSPPPFGYYYEKVNYNYYLTAFERIMEKGSGEERELGKLYISYLMNGPTGPEGKKIETYAEKGNAFSRVLALKVTLDRDSNPEDLRRAVARLPENLTSLGYYAYFLRGDAKSRLGFFPEAQQDFQKALLIEPKNAVTNLALAALMRKMHRPNEAQALIQNLLTYHPDYIPAIVTAQSF